MIKRSKGEIYGLQKRTRKFIGLQDAPVPVAASMVGVFKKGELIRVEDKDGQKLTFGFITRDRYSLEERRIQTCLHCKAELDTWDKIVVHYENGKCPGTVREGNQ